MQQKTILLSRLALTFGAVLALSACSDFRDSLGMSQQSPDEFTVMDEAPLAVPPDFALRPPAPGAPPRSQQQAPSERAAATLFGTEGMHAMPQFGGGTTASPGEQAILTEVKAVPANSDIRALIDRESGTEIVSDSAFIQEVLFWRKDATPSAATTSGATVVNAAAEKARIDADKAAGKPVTTGATPVITHGKSGILGDWF